VVRHVTLDDIVGLERYETIREAFRRRIIELKRHRRVGVGDHITFRKNKADKNAKWGILTGHVDDLLIEQNEMSNSVQQHGIYVSNSADRPVLRGNRVWGAIHRLSLRHPLNVGRLDLAPIARPGDGNTVNAASGANHTQTNGPSYRQIIDVSNWEVVDIETSGAEEKYWLAKPGTEERWLFKSVTIKGEITHGEDWAEKSVAHLAALLDIPCAVIEMATRCGAPGCIGAELRPRPYQLQPGRVLLE